MNKTELQELTELLAMTWKKRNGETDQKMVDHCLKSGKYIKIGDMFVNVCELKPTIDSQIWYDDEGKDPGTGKKTFLHYNQHHMPDLYKLESNRRGELKYIVAYWNDKTNGKLVSLTYRSDDDRETFIRKVTPEELEKINEAVSDVRTDYAKRLENYFNRYSDKIHSTGYWRDR